MRKIDGSGLMLCEIQAAAFELSAEYMECSTKIFIRRFMNSDIARFVDNGYLLQTNLMPKDLLDRVNEEYGISEYGKIKFSRNELYWIGYIYRYYTYTYEISSRKAYKDFKPDELKKVFPAYHTLSPEQAIERLLEAKNGGTKETELERQYRIFRELRLKQRAEQEKQK